MSGTFWPGPSRLALASACGFAWSTHGPRWPKREWSETAASTFGKAFGRAIESVVVMGGPVAVATQLAAEEAKLGTSERRRLEACVAQAARTLSPTATYRAVERCVVYHVESGVASESTLDEVRRPPTGHLGGAIDLVEIDGGRLWIRDWKTGAAQAREEDIRTNWQLKAYALFCARLFGAEEVTISLDHVAEDLVWSDRVTLDDLDLAMFEDELRTLLAGLPSAVPRAGRHCHMKYCPVLAVCPVTAKDLLQIQRRVDAETALPLSPEIQSVDHAKRVRVGLKRVESALAPIKAALEAYVESHGGFEIEPGVWYGPVQHDGKLRVDAQAPGAVALIRSHLGEHADEALEVSTSAAALKRAATSRARELGDEERGAQGRVFKPLWDELAAIGAVKQGAPYTTIEEKKMRTIEAPAEIAGEVAS